MGTGDCNEWDGGIYPGAPESCWESPPVDEDCDPTTNGPDTDGDGDPDCSDPNIDGDPEDNGPDAPWAGAGSDCESFLDWIFPGAPEVCDGKDSDCDGQTPAEELDGDGDGYLACDPDPAMPFLHGGDCDDGDPLVHPDQAELCDGVDTECDGLLDFGSNHSSNVGSFDPSALDPDLSFAGNAFAVSKATILREFHMVLAAPASASLRFHVLDASTIPLTELWHSQGPISAGPSSAVQVSSGRVDINLDPGATYVLGVSTPDPGLDVFTGDPNQPPGPLPAGSLSGGWFITYTGAPPDPTLSSAGSLWYVQTIESTKVEENDGDGDGSMPCSTPPDCDSGDPTRFPGAPETCDGTDSDCDLDLVDGFADLDSDQEPDCIDPDDDGDGDPDVYDCAPVNAATFHGAPENCDEEDSDCDGDLVDGYANLDGDLLPDCIDPDDDGDEHLDASADCDPTNPTIYFDAPETPDDGIDQDCNTVDATLCHLDLDGDVFGGPTLTLALDGTCDVPAGEFLSGDDCDDNDPAVHPYAPEFCEGRDTDCDPIVDVPGGDIDQDGDGLRGCAGDCDDLEPTTYPGAYERCDVTDSDCDSDLIDEFDDEDGDVLPDCIGTVIYDDLLVDLAANGWTQPELDTLNAALHLIEPPSDAGESAQTPCELALDPPGSSAEADAFQAALAEFAVDTAFVEDFEEFSTSTAPCDDWSQDSATHGDWITQFASGMAGSAPCSTSDPRGAWVEPWPTPAGSTVLRQRPFQPMNEYSTSATLVLSNGPTNSGLEWMLMEVDLGTVAQNRSASTLPPDTLDPLAPNAWEVAWITWRHAWDDTEPALFDAEGTPVDWLDGYGYDWDRSPDPGIQAPCEDGERFYYFLLQSEHHQNEDWPGVWELGKFGPEQNVEPDGPSWACNHPIGTGTTETPPVVRATLPANEPTDLSNACVWSWGDRTEIWVDGYKVQANSPPEVSPTRSFVDRGGREYPAVPAFGEPLSPVLGPGAVGLYNEDAAVVFDNVAIVGDSP